MVQEGKDFCSLRHKDNSFTLLTYSEECFLAEDFAMCPMWKLFCAPLSPTCQTSGPQQASAPPPSTAPHGRTTFLRRSTSSKTSKAPPPSGYQQNCNYANYQNCTIVRSHLPHANYGTYVKLAPKILIFPIFVQPLDLCNPTRTLVVTEEMILHESKHLSLKVTVFIYTDLMLVTREDEPGRCNVLQNPLFLQHLRLRDGEFPHILELSKCDCLLSLEAYSAEQKRRFCQCLGDHIEKQLQRRETPSTTEKVGSECGPTAAATSGS
uniref:Si:ch211-154e10.1 n=1 Tax=Scleropages formosus TaxID=113540 RepID=A0A8D0CD57_SCLFO